MAYGCDTLRTLLKRKLHNDAALTDPTDFNIYLTLGQNRIVRDCPAGLGVKSATLSLTAASRSYALASDVYQVVRVNIPSQNCWLEYVPPGRWIEEIEGQNVIGSGTPQQYTISGVRLDDATPVLELIVDLVPDTLTAYYWYYWMPAAATGTTVLPHCAAGFDNLVLAAAAMIALEDKNPDEFLVAVQNYERELKAFRDYTAFRPGWRPRMGPKDMWEDEGGSTLTVSGAFGGSYTTETVLPE